MIIPKHVQYKWNLLQSAGLKLYLCGGAVRDSILNRTIKDWDFYLCYTEEKFLAACEKTGIRVVKKSGEQLEDYSSNQTLQHVYEDESADIQYMLLSEEFSPKVIEEFGCSLSKCWYDGVYIHLSPDFVESLQTGVIWYNDTDKVRLKYLDKMKSYFQTYTFKKYTEKK